MRNETEDREYEKASEDASTTVDDTDDERISVAVVVELIVARHGDHSARTGTQGIEDLGCCIRPYLNINLRFNVFITPCVILKTHFFETIAALKDKCAF